MLSSSPRSLLACVVVSLIVLSTGRSAPPTQPTDKQIAKWVEELGDNSFAVREKASKKLWQAGAAAESVLEQALKSDDPEVVRRARDLLDKFRWGIYPDTPANVVALIEAYRSAEGNGRRDIAQKLLQAGDAGLRAVLKIARAVKDDNERRILSDLIAEQLPSVFLRSVTEGKRTEFERLLEPCHEAHLVGHVQYAAYWLLRGQLSERIEHYRAQLSKHPDDKWAAQTLAYLHRANGNLTEARKAAEKSGNDELLDGILLEMSDWKALSDRAESAKPKAPAENGIHVIRGADNPAEKWAYRAAFARLAGKSKEFDNAVAELKKFAGGGEDRDGHALLAAQALLLNDRPKEGLELLRSTKNDALLFDVLCARLAFAEALKLEASDAGKNNRPETLDFNKARILHLLGEKDKARGLFDRFGEQIKDGVDPYWVYNLLQMESRAGLKELALEHCAKALGVSPRKTAARKGMGAFESMYLGQLFPDQGTAAEVWWMLLRKKFKDESAAAVLKRVRQVLEGKAAAKDVKTWIEEADKNKWLDQPGERVSANYRQALGETAAKAGLDDLAVSLLEQADTAEALLRLGDVLAAKKQWAKAAQRYQQAWKQEQRADKPPVNAFRAQSARSPDPLPLYLAGDALVHADRAAEGKKLMEQAHEVPWADSDRRYSFLRALAKRGHVEAARRETDLLMRVSKPNSYHSGAATRHLAVAALRRKDYLKAAEGFEQSMLQCLRPHVHFVSNAAYVNVPAQIHQLRASGLLAAGKLDAARKEIDLALTVSPGYADVPIHLVPELERRGHKKEATDLFNSYYRLYEKTCGAYPGCAWAHNSAAWMSACCRRNLDKALTHAQKAVELAPENAGYLDTLAEVHFQLGDKDRAVALQKRVIELDPKKSYYRKQLKRLQAGDANAERPPENEEE